MWMQEEIVCYITLRERCGREILCVSGVGELDKTTNKEKEGKGSTENGINNEVKKRACVQCRTQQSETNKRNRERQREEYFAHTECRNWGGE